MGVLRRLKTRYYVPSHDDSVAVRAWKSAASRRVPRFPRTVQFETHTGCNGACIFCPYADTIESQPKGRMRRELFEKIVDEMSHHRVRRISPYLNNEPFLDREIVRKVRYVHERVPKAKIVLTTNGSGLDDRTIDQLLEADALHALYISFQGVEKAGYEATMRGGLVFDDTLAKVENLIAKWRAAGGVRRFKIVVTMVATNLIDVEKAVGHWKRRGVESQWTRLENRGGNIARAPALAPRGSALAPFGNCTRLFKQAYIQFNGDMILCCTDYTRKVVLGNVAKSSIEAVWNGQKARAIRRLYAAGKLDEIPLCGECMISDAEREEESD